MVGTSDDGVSTVFTRLLGWSTQRQESKVVYVMSDFQPIPGVKYAIAVGTDAKGYPEHVEWMYAPWWSSDPEPWVDEDGESHAWKPEYSIFDIAYNPHPPTRTEWGVQAGIGDKFERAPFEEGAQNDPVLAREALTSAREEFPEVPFLLLTRQVSEWKEVTDV
jgi:hypothetical protein